MRVFGNGRDAVVGREGYGDVGESVAAREVGEESGELAIEREEHGAMLG